MRQRGLRFKLTVLYTAIISVLLSGFFLAAYYLLAGQLEGTATDELERFYRADESRSKDIEGVGLGLSLVKWIVDQHQGTIFVESESSQGARFRIVLPEH